MATHEPEVLLSPSDLSRRIGVPVSTLYGWVGKGEGPAVLKLGRHLRYRPRDVERWLDSRENQRREIN
jgi:excisionase family DNA binding protein